MFLNTFLQLSKKAKIDDSQALDMLYEKFRDEFKNWLATIRKTKNLNDLILLDHNMNAKMKKISKLSQLRIKLNASTFPATKPPFNSYNSASTKPSTAVGVAIVFPVPSTATETYPSPMDVSNMIKRGLILQEEKDKRNTPGLCCYYGKPGHIAIDHRNPALLTNKRQAIGALTGNLISLVLYKPLPVEKKEIFLG